MRLLTQCIDHHCWSSAFRCLYWDSLSLQRDRRCCPEPHPCRKHRSPPSGPAQFRNRRRALSNLTDGWLRRRQQRQEALPILAGSLRR
jgi:hypothetical protein